MDALSTPYVSTRTDGASPDVPERLERRGVGRDDGHEDQEQAEQERVERHPVGLSRELLLARPSDGAPAWAGR